MGAAQTRTCDCAEETAESYERMSIDDTPIYNSEAKAWREGMLSEINFSEGFKPECRACGKDGMACYVTRSSNGGWYYCTKCVDKIVVDEKWNFCYGNGPVVIYHRPKAICKVKRAE